MFYATVMTNVKARKLIKLLCWGESEQRCGLSEFSCMIASIQYRISKADKSKIIILSETINTSVTHVSKINCQKLCGNRSWIE